MSLDPGYCQITVAVTLEELDRALGVVERGLRETHALREKRLEDDFRGADLAEEGLEGWDDSEQIAYRKRVLDQIAYRSLFLIFWATFLRLLSGYSKEVERYLSLDRSERDLYGKGARRSVDYLRKEAGVRSIDLGGERWRRVKAYNDLRNHLVHRGSSLRDRFGDAIEKADDPEDSPEVEAALEEMREYRRKFERLPGVEVDLGTIVLGPEFLPTVLGTVGDFLSYIGARIQEDLVEGSGEPPQPSGKDTEES